MYRIGVDVGGTNTDGVILDIRKASDPETRGVLAFYKHATTVNVTDGIEAAVRNVLTSAGVDPAGGDVLSLTIGTTHFINAVVQSDSRRLSKVAVIRLAAPYSEECPPFIDFPQNLKRIMNGHTAIISGGLQIDGRTINPIVESELVEQAARIRAKGLKDIVLVGVFSPLDVSGTTEYAARDILQRELGPGVNIVCSRDVGQIGFIERENASILNASISTFAQRTIRGFERAMERSGLKCPLYITQNDGTLTTASAAARLPIRTFSSGATNSMRGASFLAGIDLRRKEGTGGEQKTMLVVDVGGTTTDVGVLLPSGFPRQAAAFIEVGGVRTNFAMPDVNSIGLGGGSRVRVEGRRPKVMVGPDSIGHYLTRDAQVFGGDVLTATDICVASGEELAQEIGDKTRVGHVSGEVVKQAQGVVKKLMESVVDRMKTSPEDCTLLLVGGGSIIAPKRLEGVGEIITPPFHSVANAVGAAIANVSGEVDTIEVMQGKNLHVVLEKIKEEAKAKAVQNGADVETVRVVEVAVLPVQYVTNQATRLIVRAVGEIGVPQGSQATPHISDGHEPKQTLENTEDEPEDAQAVLEEGADVDSTVKVDYENYLPKIVGNEWVLSETDLFFIMEGCGILGTGGGGSPYPTYLMCRQILREGGTIRIIDHSSLPDDAQITRGAGMGSPSVDEERMSGGRPIMVAGQELAKFMGVSKISATLADEIGGGNGMTPLLTSHYYGVPALDADLMGRAYPMINQLLPAVYNRPNSLVPCSLCDGDGNVVILTKVKNQFYVESLMRTVTTEMGSSAALCMPSMALSDVRGYGVQRTQSQAWWIGRAVAICRQKNNLMAIPDEILKIQNGKCLFIGKIVNVSREVRAGFTWGEIRIARLRDDEVEDASSALVANEEGDDQMIIPFQNENLAAYVEKHDGSRSMVAIVPDLIVVLDSQSGSHLGTQMYSYGLRVTVIALAGSPLWTTEAGLKCGGPSAFGLSDPYLPIGEYITPKSVIEHFRA
ncbi:Hydantoinase/oxoprolinase [Dendrothele bispora CBS 962.96]|uniref:Hydantoinase/oxoprolinase n=1 Tax=Dendrothele bispora (strain CBS 962.96) TaxID=1314807 RepID=A0A4V4HFX1_DENBC|nr:Hydantoinase/oxoprolinase [Dendrothele bispora CBS 962.96]